MNITPWYYDYYEINAFPRQQKLCIAVRFTTCNLEGQKLTSYGHLTGITVNALTLRLRALRKAENSLNREFNNTRTFMRKYLNKLLQNKGNVGMGGTLHSEKSQLKTGGAVIIEYKLDDGESIIIHHDKLHFALYDFFTNISSILDRLAYEVNLLYGLGGWINNRLNWNTITNTNKRFFTALTKKDKNLAQFIECQKSNFDKIAPYRNRLVHDSILKTEIEDSPFQYNILLPENPNDANSNMSINAKDLCKDTRKNILALLDGSYELMLKHIHSHGNPPW